MLNKSTTFAVVHVKISRREFCLKGSDWRNEEYLDGCWVEGKYFLR